MSTSTITRYVRRAALAVAITLGIVAGGGGLYAAGQSMGRNQVGSVDGGIDAHAVADIPAPAAAPAADAAAPSLKLPTMPPSAAQSPGDAASGAMAWLKLSWIYAALFAAGSLALAAGALWPSLRKGRKAIAIGTFVAAVSSALGAKAAGLPDGQIVFAALSIVMTGAAWGLSPNRTTVDFSTATPEQIADALKRAGAPSSSPA